ncbi:dihydropteroate synthase [Cyanobium sp. Cruz CV13-4-11]|uniref:dihydropteroate synthase n=1 Tax=unclassified Cyanobium TaxID=2627006 RepID=UPI0020CCBFCB|nr:MULTISPECIES: dihydropteroate synthase [unclassified Cyanobium]MCP9901377.1 dihydropteroate synthase [Cyanobium sp. Cruz CV11-17]MCP9919157.1 dihydropteroate synthase [Cyanobium sp. Cruz CV13-4-11]
MGVLNLSPDSFSDGGRLNSVPAALKAAKRMLAQGADLLDLGGQSTRPGAEIVGPGLELERLYPVLAAMQELRAAHPGCLMSVDTFEASVAEAALAAGADWINDVRGANRDGDTSLRDPQMLPLIARAGCPYVLMHSRGDSQTMDDLAVYDDVVAEVRSELLAATQQALAAGVKAAQLIWDPGLGFAKTTEQNLALLRGLADLCAEGFPLLVGPSRKRFIGAVLNEPRPRARLWGTAAVCGQAIAAGASILRVHDVGPIVQVARLVDALGGAHPAGPAAAERAAD